MQIEANLLKGYYIFFDYAMAYWWRHFEAALLGISSSEDIAFIELSESIEVFLDLHWTDPKVEISIPRSLRERVRMFHDRVDIDKLAKAIVVSKKQSNAYEEPSEDERVLDLVMIRQQVKSILEDANLNVIIHTNTADNLNAYAEAEPFIRLHELYGPNQFKCSRISCKFFYQGFETKAKRDEHIAKHERKYFCSFPDCPMATLGCVTATDLRKHENEKHNMLLEDSEFPDPNLDKEEKVFICGECGNQFTRKHNLTLHTRIHKKEDEEERLVCRHCPQTFGRQGARRPHEITQHSDTQEFKCGGRLEDGTEWGCGKIFNRAENLARHYKSKRGGRCVPPDRDGAQLSEEIDDDAVEEGMARRDSAEHNGADTPIPNSTW